MKRSTLIAIVGLVTLAVVVVALEKDDAPQAIKLSEPRTDGGIPLDKALKERRSIRDFGGDGLNLDEVSQLLWAAQGVTDDNGHRTAPSAMAKYPLEVYLLAGNVTGLPKGVYHYSPTDHSLAIIKQDEIDEYYDASIGFNDWARTAPALFIITGVLNGLGEDSSQWVYVEAGAAAENLLLEVVSLDLAATYTTGFDAGKIEELLELPEGEVPIEVIPVGRTA
jgi:SagB-type dehydrogenase family enzyme